MFELISKECIKSDYQREIEKFTLSSESPIYVKIQGKTNEIADSITWENPLKYAFEELSGYALRLTGNRSYYQTSDNMSLDLNGYILNGSGYASCEYEIAQMDAFKMYLDSKNIRLLYVNEPSKYLDDKYYEAQFGSESYLNDNMDRFLGAIGDKGIEYLDLRQSASEQELDILEMFYKTDHHWRVPTSKWAASEIVHKMNKDYGYKINEALYDDSNFQFAEFKNAWIGEQGRLLSKALVGMDDYTAVWPAYKTDYTIIRPDGTIENTDFGAFLDTSVYYNDVVPYDSPLWHYSYQVGWGTLKDCHIHNNDMEKGRILVLGDSYETCMVPFLSLGVSDIDFVCLRDAMISAKEVVEKGNYDMVIMAYAQFMLGSYDREDSDNRAMFNLVEE